MIEYERGSIIDPVGRIFYCDGEVYRGIYENEARYILDMFECGLINELCEAQMIPHTEIADLKLEKFPLVLHHEKVRNPAYIQEWSFNMIKDAALLILELEKRLLKYGYCLKDSHSYNVMFKNEKPVYVDIGSFIKYTKAGRAVREFYAYYDQILKMFSAVPSIARERLLSRHYIGVRYNLYYLEGILHGGDTFQCIDDRINEISEIDNTAKLVQIIEKEKNVIQDYSMEGESAWGNYQDNFTDDVYLIEHVDNARFKKIVKLCEDLKVSSILELAANQGILSRMLSAIPTVKDIFATDYDEVAVDKLYLYLKMDKCPAYCKQKIHPMVYDVTSDFLPNISLRSFVERACSDVVIACALTHHLLLTQHVNIDSIFDKLSRLTKKYLIIEFMPLGLWGGGELPEIPAWYTEQWFVRHMEKRFHILERGDSKHRILFLAEKKIDD